MQMNWREKADHLQELVENEPVRPSDVIVWLQGDRLDRAARVLELWNRKIAPIIVVSGNDSLVGPSTRTGENNISTVEMARWLLNHEVPPQAIVVDDESFNTRDQAVNVLNLAEEKGWSSLVLVGSLHHQMRPFLTFLKRAKEILWGGQLLNQPTHIPGWNKIPAGRFETARQIYEAELMKMQEYVHHVATVDDGLRYWRNLHD